MRFGVIGETRLARALLASGIARRRWSRGTLGQEIGDGLGIGGVAGVTATSAMISVCGSTAT